jgi:hypothetical protein
VTAPASAYADRLLRSFGLEAPVGAAPDPVEDWARSGAMALTGRPEGPPLTVTGPAVAMRGALLALEAVGPGAALPGIGLLGERAAYAGHGRRGEVSCGGASRLLSTLDGTIAVTLARDSDLELVPALVESEVVDPWDAVTAWLRSRTTATAGERLALLGLPFGIPDETAADLPWVVTERRASSPTTARPVVVNLGALWAGPLAGSLLRALGCRVVKVEDIRRPDGARGGPADFYELLNDGVEEVALDLSTVAGRAELAELLRGADVVIEGSRPRALAQLGVPAEEVIAAASRMTWVSITGHGRVHDRVGFGDDAAVAGGLVRNGCFVADAIADPLTGVHAALAGWMGIQRGGARLVDVALSRVAATAHALDTGDVGEAFLRDGTWWVRGAEGAVPVAEPRRR